MNRESFVFHREWYDAIKELDDNVRFEIYDAIVAEAFELETKQLSPFAEMAMKFIRQRLSNDKEKYEAICRRNSVNGAKGGRPKKILKNPNNPVGILETQENPKNPDKPKKADIDIDNDIQDTNVSMSIEEKDTNVSKKKTKEKTFNVREDLSYVDCFSDLWNEWLDYKDEIKKQYKTQRGAKSSFTQLKNLSGGDYFKAKAILEQSYRKSWDGFYDIKDWDSNNSPSLFSKQEQESLETKRIDWE